MDVVANATNAPPIWVAGRFHDSGTQDGISSKNGKVTPQHKANRNRCVRDFAKDYGRNPLVKGSVYVTSGASRSWSSGLEQWQRALEWTWKSSIGPAGNYL